MVRRIIPSLLGIGLVLVSGCGAGEFSTSIWNPLGLRPLFGPSGEPVRIGIVEQEQTQSVLNPISWVAVKKAPWTALRQGLTEELGRPVVVEPLEPFQISAHLQSGRIQFALLSASDFLELSKEGEIGHVVALSEARQRRGLIVAAARSGIETLQDVRGRRFAFGPKDDEVLHRGALAVLAEAGITPDDLAKELVPIPGVLQYHISSREAAKEVVYGVDIGKVRTEAGVIEEEEYDSFPDTGGRWLPLAPTFSKDQFRILARGEPVRVETIPDGPVVSSREADPELVEAVRDFLLSAASDHKQVVADLGMKRFRRPPSNTRAEIERLRLAAGDTAKTDSP